MKSLFCVPIMAETVTAWPYLKMTDESVLLVVAAVIERQDQHKGKQILICQRKNRRRHALKWEFPGGKVEAGETPQAALKRELQEELGIHAEIGEEITRYDFRYGTGVTTPTTTTRLLFFSVTQFTGELQNLDFTQFLWEMPANLPNYDFLEGDVDFVKQLAETR